MKKIYIFSGLGPDKRVFQFMNFSDFDTTFIEWINPIKNESIENYALRLTKQITSNNPILIGLSLGGIMAIEVAKHITTEKIILIASAKTKNEIPFYFRIAGKFKLHHILPSKLLLQANVLTYWFFGIDKKTR